MDYRPIARRTRGQEDAEIIRKWKEMKEKENKRQRGRRPREQDTAAVTANEGKFASLKIKEEEEEEEEEERRPSLGTPGSGEKGKAVIVSENTTSDDPSSSDDDDQDNGSSDRHANFKSRRSGRRNVGLEEEEGNDNVALDKGEHENLGGHKCNGTLGVDGFDPSDGDDGASDSEDDIEVWEKNDESPHISVVELSSTSENADDCNAPEVSSAHGIKQELPDIETIEEDITPNQQFAENSQDSTTNSDSDESSESDDADDLCNSDDPSLSDDDDDDDDSYFEEESDDGGGADVRSTVGVPKRKRGRPPGTARGLKTIQGLKMMVDNDDGRANTSGHLLSQDDHSNGRRRTRSLSSSQSLLPKEKLKYLGTWSNPFSLDSESSKDNEEEKEQEEIEKMGCQVQRKSTSYCARPKNGCHDDVHDDDYSMRKSYDSQKRMRRSGNDESGLPKRRRFDRSKNCEVHDILINSILGNGDSVLEDVVENVLPPDADKSPLPLQFKYRLEESDDEETQKSEIDEELDGLWKELDLALTSCEIGADVEMQSQVHNEDSPASSRSEDIDPCGAGNHYLILDDEVGLKCKFCSHVSLEIQHVMPDFNKNPFGRSEDRDYYYRMTPGLINGQMFADLGCEGPQDIRTQTYQPTDTVWDIIPSIKYGMYPHQREGFEFLWRNIAGGIQLDELRKGPNRPRNGGCIISHAPGTGKTRLAIAFLQAYMKFYQNSRPVVVAPCSMLMTWEEEFRRWNVEIPFHSLNNDDLTGKEDPKALSLLRVTGRQDPRIVRLAKFYSWKNHESVLGISYRLFEQLVNNGEGIYNKTNGKVKRRKEEKDGCLEKVWKDLLKLPGLLILDEGHTPRNDNSLLFKAFLNVETERRVILSGTPFQNNFGELYNTLCLVRPQFVHSFLSSRTQSIPVKRGRKGLCTAKQDFLSAVGGDENDKGRIDDLRAKIKPFVHVHKGNILQKTLPGLRDSVVHLQPSPMQKDLIGKVQRLNNFLKVDNLVALISVHPSLLDDDANLISKAEQQKMRTNINAGVKTWFVMELIRLSLAIKERVLIFSQYLPPLMYLIEHLQSRFGWTEGRELLYMDGRLELKNRQSSISSFNDPNSDAKVLLASTRACCEGISLVGASRVVLLDVVWNPSVERQAISRAYRLGQKKVVHVYHLITSGTNEEEKYERQVMKNRLSELIFRTVDKGNMQIPEISSQVCEDKILDEMVHHENLKSMFVKIYQPRADDLVESFGTLVNL